LIQPPCGKYCAHRNLKKHYERHDCG
jgi:hypothetical protein